MKTFATIVAVALLGLALFGCGPLDVLTEKAFSVFMPPAKSRPVASLSGKSVVILVDCADPGLSDRYPRLTLEVAKAVAQELSDRRAAESIVSPRDVVTYAQGDPGYARRSVVDIGRAFKVDLVVHVIVQGYALERATAGDTYAGQIAVGVRLVDVKAGEQVYPGMNQLHLLDAKTVTGITADSPEEAEGVLLDGLARKVGQMFVPYDLESMPMNPPVK